MKKILSTLLFLLTLSPMVFAQEDQPKMPFDSMCLGVTRHQQEERWCNAWEKGLERFPDIRIRQPEDTMGLHSIVLVEYCGRTRTIGVSTTVIFVSPYFAGQFPWLMSNLKVVEPGDWSDTIDQLIEDMWKAFEGSAEGLGEAIEILRCSQGKQNYQSAEGEYDTEIYKFDPFDPLDREPFFDRPELCSGSDIMFNLSTGR